MEMARVIVDVPSKDTDRPFDYLIPEELRPWVEVGDRVGVPFGHRTLQGFVISLHPWPEMDTAKMKPIQEVLDVMPPLSPELIELGEWMKERYACRYISVLQSIAYGAEREGGAVHFHWRFRHVADGSNRRIICAPARK